jgi:adenylate kinase
MTDARDPAAISDDWLILVLVGAVGTGKGTQAKILSKEFGLPHLASGNLFRAALAAGTPLGEEARHYMERGELVPDGITINMFMDELARPHASRGAILDGFPRTVGQSVALDETLAKMGEKVDRVIFIEVPPEDIIRRVAGRLVCPTDGTTYHETADPPKVPGICDRDGTPLKQRDDDRPEVVRARLDQQVPPMLGVVDHYEQLGVATRVDGRQPIDAVTRDILVAVREAR